jgi:hypothetical protein
MYAEAQEALRQTGAVWAPVTEAGAALADDIRTAVQVDTATGEVSFTGDRLDTLLQATSEAPRGVAEEVRRQFALGVAPFPDGAGIPWFALSDPGFLSTLGPNFWEWLGVPPGASTGDVLNRLTELYPRVPDAFSTPNNLQTLANGSASNAVEQALREARQAAGLGLAPIRRNRIGPPMSPLGIADAALGAMPPPQLVAAAPPLAAAPVATALAIPPLEQLGRAAWCFLTETQWTVHWYGYIEVCMDRACADNILTVFAAMGALDFLGAISTAIHQIIIQGALAALKGFITASGGWVAAAIMTFVAYWWAMINWNVTEQGVCCFHRAPWAWWLPHFPPGWAQGR